LREVTRLRSLADQPEKTRYRQGATSHRAARPRGRANSERTRRARLRCRSDGPPAPSRRSSAEQEHPARHGLHPGHPRFVQQPAGRGRSPL